MSSYSIKSVLLPKILIKQQFYARRITEKGSESD